MLTTYLVSAKVQTTNRKRGTVPPTRKLPPTLPDQQQPSHVTESNMNDSQLPLVPKDRRLSKRDSFTRSNTIKQTFDEMRKVAREDEEELGLAGAVQWVNCSIRETLERREYRIACTVRDMKSLKIGAWMTVAIFGIVHLVFICAFIGSGASHGSGLIIVFRLATMVGIVAHALFLSTTYASFAFPWSVSFLYAFTSFICTATLYTVNEDFVYAIVLEVMYCILVVNHICGLPFGFILCAGLISIISWILIVLNLYEDMSVSIEPTFFIVIFAVVNMAASFVREAQDRKTYNLNKLAAREIQNTENILKQMMPSHVVKNLKNGVAPTESYEKVTILYADIVGFTAWSSNRKPIEVVTMLSKLFTTFDHLCVKNHVYKVHTIGDCYVILGFADTGDGTDRHYGNEAINMINMAFDMLKAIKKVNKEKKMSLNMRIGLHTGTLIAGNIANKMESGGAAGKINVSEDTRQMLDEMEPGRFEYLFNKVIKHEPTNRSLESFFISPVNQEELI